MDAAREQESDWARGGVLAVKWAVSKAFQSDTKGAMWVCEKAAQWVGETAFL